MLPAVRTGDTVDSLGPPFTPSRHPITRSTPSAFGKARLRNASTLLSCIQHEMGFGCELKHERCKRHQSRAVGPLLAPSRSDNSRPRACEQATIHANGKAAFCVSVLVGRNHATTICMLLNIHSTCNSWLPYKDDSALHDI